MANRGKFTRETPLPQRVTQNDDALAFSPVFFRKKLSTDCRMDAQHLKIICGHWRSTHMLRRIPQCEVEAHVGPAGDTLENLSHALQTLELCCGEVQLARLRLVHFDKLDDFVRLRKWQRTKQHSVDDGENGAVGADAEGERKNSDGGEAWGFAQHAEGETEVLPACVHKGFPASRANFFLGDFQIAAFQTHGAKRRVAAHATCNFVLGRHFQESTQLFV